MTGGGPEDDPPMVPFAEWAAGQEAAPDGCEAGEAAGDEGEAVRPARQTASLAYAAAWSLPFGLVMLLTADWAAGTARRHFIDSREGSAVPPHPPPYLLWLLMIGGACWVVSTVAELLYASRLASDYPPRGPWARLPVSPVVRAVRKVTGDLDRKLGAGGGCFGVLTLALLGPLIVLVWSVAAAAAAPLWVLIVGSMTLMHLTSVF